MFSINLDSKQCLSQYHTTSTKVIVVGAGAAGLTAAYLLTQKGIDVEILEASSIYGGRMKRTKSFADFPIPTGAEWLHTKRKVLKKILNDPKIQIDINTTEYNFDEDYALLEGEKVSLKKLGFTIDDYSRQKRSEKNHTENTIVEWAMAKNTGLRSLKRPLG